VLRVTRAAAAALRRACEAASPREACGTLVGRCGADGPTAVDALPARGALARGAFEISGHELRRMSAWAEDRGLQIVAVFHSHPTGALELSGQDRDALRHAVWPWVVATRAAGGAGEIILAAYAPGDARPLEVRIER
jgi:proteasome lid subunit RPN8/RPN11